MDHIHVRLIMVQGMEARMAIKASDCKCIRCGKKAVAFWPVCDPDIPENPYCRECLDSVKQRVMMEMFEISKKYSRSTNSGKVTK